MSVRVLIVDDEPQIRRALSTGLRANGYDVVLAEDGEAALMQAAANPPDLVILDLEMPVLGGLDVIKELREWSHVPIIVLSAHAQEHEKVQALDAGADDYLTKPFGMDELLARTRVALRHGAGQREREGRLEFDGLTIDLVARIVRVDGSEVHLTPTEYELLRALATNAGRVLTHHMLLTEVWGPASADATNYLRVYINQLRKKIEVDPMRPRLIVTEPGIGYRFRSSESSSKS